MQLQQTDEDVIDPVYCRQCRRHTLRAFMNPDNYCPACAQQAKQAYAYNQSVQAQQAAQQAHQAAIKAANAPPPVNSRKELLQSGRTAVTIGSLVAGYNAMFFDTTVPTEFGRVYNIGLMHQQQLYVMMGLAVAVVGAIMIVASRPRS